MSDRIKHSSERRYRKRCSSKSSDDHDKEKINTQQRKSSRERYSRTRESRSYDRRRRHSSRSPVKRDVQIVGLSDSDGEGNGHRGRSHFKRSQSSRTYDDYKRHSNYDRDSDDDHKRRRQISEEMKYGKKNYRNEHDDRSEYRHNSDKQHSRGHDSRQFDNDKSHKRYNRFDTQERSGDRDIDDFDDIHHTAGSSYNKRHDYRNYRQSKSEDRYAYHLGSANRDASDYTNDEDFNYAEEERPGFDYDRIKRYNIMEEIYLPDTEALDDYKTKWKIIHELVQIKRELSLKSVKLSIDAKNKHYVFIRCDSLGVLAEAKTQITAVVHEVITKMRQHIIRENCYGGGNKTKNKQQQHDAVDQSGVGADKKTKAFCVKISSIAAPEPPVSEELTDADIPRLTNSIGVMKAAAEGLLCFMCDLESNVTELALHMAIMRRLASSNTMHNMEEMIEHVAYKPYQSARSKGFAVVKFNNRRQFFVFMMDPHLLVKETKVLLLNSEKLALHSNHEQKKQLASLVRDITFTQRPPGVFPQGVQPDKIVLVIDDKVPYINIKQLKSEISVSVLHGSDLDAYEFLELIRNDYTFDRDNILYVVIPWLSFFLRNLKIHSSKLTDNDGKSEKKRKHNIPGDITSVNIVRDFCFNRVMHTNYKGSHDVMSFVDNPVNTRGTANKSSVALARRLVHSAHYLRTAVVSRTSNTDLIFCGFPVTGLEADHAQYKLADMMHSNQISEVTFALFAAMRIFNKFAANTWKLGSFYFPDLENLTKLPTKPTFTEKGKDSDIEIIDQVMPKVLIKVEPVECGNSSDSDCNKTHLNPKKKGHTVDDPPEINIKLNDCGAMVLDSWCDLKWAKPVMPDTSLDDVSEEENTDEVPSDKGKAIDETCVNLVIKEEKEDKYSDVTEEGSDNVSIKNKKDTGEFHYERLIKKEVDSETGSQTGDEAVSSREVDSTPKAELEGAVVQLDSDDDMVNALIKDVMQGAVHSEYYEQGKDEETIDNDGHGVSAKITDESPTGEHVELVNDEEPETELKQPTYETVKENKDLTEAYTDELKKSIKLVKRVWKKKGAFTPWTPLESEEFDGSTLPDVVAQSIEHDIFSEQWNDNTREAQYNCCRCEGQTGDLKWAEQHAYDRNHVAALINSMQCGAAPPPAALINGAVTSDNDYGLSKEYMHKMVNAGLLLIEGSNYKMPDKYKCLVCQCGFSKIALRFHVGHLHHKQMLNSHLGLTSQEDVVQMVENWTIIKRLYRQSSYDAVVLVADNIHRHLLEPLARLHSNVHLYTFPDLVSSEDSQMEMLKRWNSDSLQLMKEIDDPRALWIIVAGIDLFIKPKAVSCLTRPMNQTPQEHQSTTAKPNKPFIAFVAGDVVGEPATSGLSDMDDDADATDIVPDANDVCVGIASANGDAIVPKWKNLQGEFDASVSSDEAKQAAGTINDSNPSMKMDGSLSMDKSSQNGAEDNDVEDAEALKQAVMKKLEANTLQNPCCGSWYYDIGEKSSKFDIVKSLSVDKALHSLNELQSFLRLRLDHDHSIVTVPVVPLHLMLDSLPRRTKKTLRCSHQTIVAAKHQIIQVQNAYKFLFDKSYGLYKTFTERENILNVEDRAMKESIINIVKCVDDCQWLNYDSWHAPVETLILNALTGMPCPYPKNTTSVNYASEIGLKPRTNTCAVIGNPRVFPANEYTFVRLVNITQNIKFYPEDVDVIIDALAAHVNYDRNVKWTVHIVCQFPHILFKSQMLDACVKEKCNNPIISWKYDKANSLHKILDRVMSFLSLLSYKLGPGNFATVFPVYPAAIIGFDSCDELNHATMHRAATKNPNAYFCFENYRDVLNPVIKKFNKGLTDIFNMTKLCSPLDEDDGECFSFIKALPLMLHTDLVIPASTYKQWLSTVNKIFQRTHAPIAVTHINTEGGGPAGPKYTGIFNPSAWSNNAMEPTDQSMTAGPEGNNYFNVSFNYDGEGGSAMRGNPGNRRGGFPRRGRGMRRGGPGFDPYMQSPEFLGGPQRFHGRPWFRGRGRGNFNGGGPDFQGGPNFFGGRPPFYGMPNFHGMPRFNGPNDFQGMPRLPSNQENRARYSGIYSAAQVSDGGSDSDSSDSEGTSDKAKSKDCKKKKRSRSHNSSDEDRHSKKYKNNKDGKKSKKKSKKTSKKRRKTASSSNTSSSDTSSSSEEYDASDPDVTEKSRKSSRKHKDKKSSKKSNKSGAGDQYVNPFEEEDELFYLNARTPPSAPCQGIADADQYGVLANYRRSSYHESQKVDDDSSPESGSAPFTITISSGQNMWPEVWVNKLIQYFQLQPNPTPKIDGSWAIGCRHGRVASFMKRNFTSIRVLDFQLSCTVQTTEELPSGDADRDSIHRVILKQLMEDYNRERVSDLLIQISRETDTSFFGSDWQDVYTSDLTNTFLIAADAVRSLTLLRGPTAASSPNTKVLIITPDSETTSMLSTLLEPTISTVDAKLLVVTDSSTLDVHSEVVVGTLHHLCEVEHQLLLSDLRAVIIDNAAFIMGAPLYTILVKQLVTHLKIVVRNYDCVNKVAVVGKINVKELCNAEKLLNCHFIRTNLKQHFASSGSESSSRKQPSSSSNTSQYQLNYPPPTQQQQQQNYPQQQLNYPPPQQHLNYPPPQRQPQDQYFAGPSSYPGFQ